MSIYILFWLAAGGAALDHIDETFHGFKVHIPSNDDGSGGHVASEGTEKSRSRFSHKFRWCLDNWFMYQENDLRRENARSDLSHQLLQIFSKVCW